MTSFDDAFSEHKDKLTRNLVAFSEAQRVRKLILDIDSNVSEYEYYFYKGQQAKQAEVVEYRLVAETLDDLYVKEMAKNKELQKRLDDAINYADDVHSENWQETINTMICLLKGKSE